MEFITIIVDLYQATRGGHIIQNNCGHAGGAGHFYDTFLTRASCAGCYVEIILNFLNRLTV